MGSFNFPQPRLLCTPELFIAEARVCYNGFMDEERDVRFVDLFDPNQPRADKELLESRLAICRTCPFLNVKQMRCKKCGCYMKLKGTLLNAKCPMDKW